MSIVDILISVWLALPPIFALYVVQLSIKLKRERQYSDRLASQIESDLARLPRQDVWRSKIKGNNN